MSSPILIDDPHTSVDGGRNEGGRVSAKVLVCLPSMSPEARQAALELIAAALPEQALLVASPEQTAEASLSEYIRLVPYQAARANLGSALAAGDYLAATTLAQKHDVESLIVLGEEPLSAEALKHFAATLQEEHIDLVLPRFTTGPHEGLVNSALLHPITLALFAADITLPLPPHAGLSRRAVERFASVAQRVAAGGSKLDSLLWPVAEAALAGFSIRQVEAGTRSLPQPRDTDFNTLFTAASGSLFADIEAKANLWQRARTFTPAAPTKTAVANETELTAEMLSMVEAYQLAYANLHEIWSLVLPPQTLLALKRLSQAPAATFFIAPNLWARIVYDVTLAFHLRTINRGHMLGAFTPLYLAWVASFLRSTGEDTKTAADLIDQTAAAFETEKPYLVARWRWPDRFNP